MTTTTKTTGPSTPFQEHVNHKPLPIDEVHNGNGDEQNKGYIKEERWIELEADALDDDDDEPEIQNLFEDPDPYDTFTFNFKASESSCISKEKTLTELTARPMDGETTEIVITLHGIKAENGQLLNSTGLTIWRASSLLCHFLCANPRLVRGKRVLELGAGMGLCGLLSYRLGAGRVVMTDGDTDALDNMRRNVASNLDNGFGGPAIERDGSGTNVAPIPFTNLLPCTQLRWGRNIEAFKRHWDVDITHGDNQDSICSQSSSGFDVIMGSDIIYTEEVLEPLFDTVVKLLSPSPEAIFLLAYARRNVKIDLVFECGKRHGLSWIEPEDVEGVFIFSRCET